MLDPVLEASLIIAFGSNSHTYKLRIILFLSILFFSFYWAGTVIGEHIHQMSLQFLPHYWSFTILSCTSFFCVGSYLSFLSSLRHQKTGAFHLISQTWPLSPTLRWLVLITPSFLASIPVWGISLPILYRLQSDTILSLPISISGFLGGWLAGIGIGIWSVNALGQLCKPIFLIAAAYGSLKLLEHSLLTFGTHTAIWSIIPIYGFMLVSFIGYWISYRQRFYRVSLSPPQILLPIKPLIHSWFFAKIIRNASTLSDLCTIGWLYTALAFFIRKHDASFDILTLIPIIAALTAGWASSLRAAYRISKPPEAYLAGGVTLLYKSKIASAMTSMILLDLILISSASINWQQFFLLMTTVTGSTLIGLLYGSILLPQPSTQGIQILTVTLSAITAYFLVRHLPANNSFYVLTTSLGSILLYRTCILREHTNLINYGHH